MSAAIEALQLSTFGADVAQSQVGIIALKAKRGEPLDDTDRAAARVLREHVAGRLSLATSSPEIPQDVHIREDVRRLFEASVATTRPATDTDVVLLEKLVDLLTRVEHGALHAADASHLIDLLDRLRATTSRRIELGRASKSKAIGTRFP